MSVPPVSLGCLRGGPHSEPNSISEANRSCLDGFLVRRADAEQQQLERATIARPSNQLLGPRRLVYVTPPLNIPDPDLDELLTIVEASVKAVVERATTP